MKRFLSLLLITLMLLTLCACDNVGGIISPKASAEPTPAPTPDPTEIVNEAETLFSGGSYSEAFDKLRTVGSLGIARVDELLGICYYYGYGVDYDYDIAMTYLKDAAESGSVCAKFLLADSADHGTGSVQDKDIADELYLDFVIAASNLAEDDAGYPVAMSCLAQCYSDGKGVDKYKSRALEALDKALGADGNGTGLGAFDLVRLAKVYEADENTDDADDLYKKAFTLLETLAKDDNPMAQKVLGDYYFDGLGGYVQDYSIAMDYYIDAAEQGNADAQAQLGYIYMNGCGVDANYERAMEWNNKAAQQGNAQGQAQIGYLYQKGLGVTQNTNTASKWYKRAADQGNEWAAEQFEITDAASSYANFQAHA